MDEKRRDAEHFAVFLTLLFFLFFILVFFDRSVFYSIKNNKNKYKKQKKKQI